MEGNLLTAALATSMKPGDAARFIKGLCREKAVAAVESLASIMVNPRMNPAARVRAAEVLLERGFGRTEQCVAPPIDPTEGEHGVMVAPATQSIEEWESYSASIHEKLQRERSL